MIRPLFILVLVCALCGVGALPLAAKESGGQEPAAKPGQATAQKVRNPLNDLLDEAQAALDKNDYEAAVAPLQKFLEEKPDVAFAHFQLAYAYTALKRPEEARAEYERCAALDPKMAEAQLNLGILLLEKEPTAAVKPLEKTVELLPSQSRPRYLLGLAQERSGDIAGALGSFEGASRLDPHDLEALTHLGGALLQSNRPAEAEAKFRAALEFEPKSPPAMQGLAASLDAQKKPEAVDAYRQYLAVQAGDRGARSRLVRLLLEQRRYDEARAETEKDAGPSPTVDILKLRADTEIGQKKYDDAIATLRQAVALAPNDAALRGGLGRTYMQQRDFANAEKELKVALKLEPNNLVFWKDLSTTYYLGGNSQATLATLEIIAKGETLGAGEWFIRALCYDKLSQVQPALDAYRKFLVLDENRNPDQVWQANQRIHVLEKQAQKKK